MSSVRYTEYEEVEVQVRKKFVVIAASAVLAAVGLGTAAAPTFAASTTVKATGNDTWSPSSKTVSKGTKVVWKNPSDDDHNVVSYKGAWSKSSSLAEGGSTSFAFRKGGTFKYRCTLHSSLNDGKCQGMCGKVVVR